MTNDPKRDQMVPQSVRLTSELAEWLEKIAKETNKSVPEVISVALEYVQSSKWKP